MKRSASIVRFIRENDREPSNAELKELLNIKSERVVRAITKELRENRVLRSSVSARARENE